MIVDITRNSFTTWSFPRTRTFLNSQENLDLRVLLKSLNSYKNFLPKQVFWNSTAISLNRYLFARFRFGLVRFHSLNFSTHIRGALEA